jgi:hypothetical protein
VQHCFVFVEVLHKFGDAAAVIELVRLFRLFALVLDDDANAFVKKRFFAQPLGKLVETEFSRIEDL